MQSDTCKTAAQKAGNSHFKGTIARVAYRCIFPATKQVGDWLFTGSDHRDVTAIVSPLFDDFSGVVEWAKGNHWHPITGTDGQLAFIFNPLN